MCWGPGCSDVYLHQAMPVGERLGDITHELPRRPRFVYARVLKLLVPSAFALCVFTYLLYASGVVKPAVAFSNVHMVWGLPASEALRAVGLTPGWTWLSRWYASDTFCLMSLALLASISPVACIVVAVQYFRRKEHALGFIALAVFLVLAAAMSGVVVNP